ncbi:MAG: hypothetical protein ACREYF_23150 [Gammaproteobacteria bacterium]
MNHAIGGDPSLLDLVLVGLAISVVVVAFYLAVHYTLWPGETSPDHIKRRILSEDEEQR